MLPRMSYAVCCWHSKVEWLILVSFKTDLLVSATKLMLFVRKSVGLVTCGSRRAL